MIAIPRSIRERRFFNDSSGYLAFLDRNDVSHEAARAIVIRFGQEHYRPYTTNVLIIEAHALILSHLGIAPAAQFLRDIDASATVIVRTRASDEE